MVINFFSILLNRAKIKKKIKGENLQIKPRLG